MKGSVTNRQSKPPAEHRHRIFLVDDHPLVREWLAGLLRPETDLELCGSAENAADTLAVIGRARADIVIADLSLAGQSGLDLIRDLRVFHGDLKILVLSMHEEADYAERVLRAGARGYIMKSESTGRIVEAIRQVLAGRVYASPAVLAKLAQRLAGGALPAGAQVDVLSDREIEVFRLLGEGCKTREVSERMKVGMKSVQVYCGRIKAKLHLANASELRREAARWVERV